VIPIHEDHGRLYWVCPKCEMRYSVRLVAGGEPDAAGTFAPRLRCEFAEREGGRWVCRHCAKEARERGAP
jgi:hypothetical protein